MSRSHLKHTSNIKDFPVRLIRRLEDGDVVIIAGQSYTQEERVAIAEHFKKLIRQGDNCLVLFVNKFSDVKRLNREQFRRLLDDKS